MTRSVTRKIADRERAEQKAEDAWNALSRRGKAVAAALARLLGDRDSLTITLKDFAAGASIPKRTLQRGIDEVEAAERDASKVACLRRAQVRHLAYVRWH